MWTQRQIYSALPTPHKDILLCIWDQTRNEIFDSFSQLIVKIPPFDFELDK